MVMRFNSKMKSISLKGYNDRSEVKTDVNLLVRYDSDRNVNYLNLIAIPKGDIISVVVSMNDEDVTIDGKFNIMGSRIEFLPEDETIQGNKAEVKYLI